MGKILIEEKIINSILKAIDIHVSLIESGNVYVKDKSYNEKLSNSIQYLKNVSNMIYTTDKQINKLKRNSYTKFVEAKKELENACLNGDQAEIEICTKKRDEALKQYIDFKKLCEELIKESSAEAK